MAPFVVDTMLDELDLAWRNWIHADQLRQSRNQNYITLNSIFIAAGGLMLSNSNLSLRYMPIASIVSCLAMTVCSVWRAVLKRNTEFQRYFRLQALELEQRRGYTTLSGYNRALYGGESIAFPTINQSFSPRRAGTVMNAQKEDLLPLVFLVFWGIALCCSAYGTYEFFRRL